MKHIKVTQEDIDGGRKLDPCGCAFALAVQREFPDDHVSVDPGEVSIDYKEFKHNGLHFVRSFDYPSIYGACAPTTITIFGRD